MIIITTGKTSIFYAAALEWRKSNEREGGRERLIVWKYAKREDNGPFLPCIGSKEERIEADKTNFRFKHRLSVKLATQGKGAYVRWEDDQEKNKSSDIDT